VGGGRGDLKLLCNMDLRFGGTTRLDVMDVAMVSGDFLVSPTKLFKTSGLLSIEPFDTPRRELALLCLR